MKPITKQIRSERRARAVDDLKKYNEKTIQQKLDSLPIGGAKKQRARLLSQLEGVSKKKETMATIPAEYKPLSEVEDIKQPRKLSKKAREKVRQEGE
jgi:hypothetical protein